MLNHTHTSPTLSTHANSTTACNYVNTDLQMLKLNIYIRIAIKPCQPHTYSTNNYIYRQDSLFHNTNSTVAELSVVTTGVC